MSDLDNTKATPAAIKQSESLWDNFLKVTSVCGAITAVILLLMAVLLV